MRDFVFDNEFTKGSVYTMKRYVDDLYWYEASYQINSIYVEPSAREYTIITSESDSVRIPQAFLYTRGFIERLREFCMKERNIFHQIRSCVETAEPVERRNELIEKRDSILESIILLCSRFCTRYVKENSILSPFDVLVFFATMGLFDNSRPYVKFCEIMERVGYWKELDIKVS
jgi:hypothetical protein